MGPDIRVAMEQEDTRVAMEQEDKWAAMELGDMSDESGLEDR